MQFVWPIKADYRIVYLEDDYSLTIIGRQKRDYLWIMAREPQISEQDYVRVLKFVAALGYETGAIRRVPQQW
jgi:apolipoprotein D and lipocalin family protein